MRKVHVIGIGAGDPRHMTVQAIEALNAVDALFLLDKGEAKADLVRLREAICARFLTNPRCRLVTAPSPPRDAEGEYLAGVAAWHDAKADLYARLIALRVRFTSPTTATDLDEDARWLLVRENLRRFVAGDRMLSVVDASRGY